MPRRTDRSPRIADRLLPVSTDGSSRTTHHRSTTSLHKAGTIQPHSDRRDSNQTARTSSHHLRGNGCRSGEEDLRSTSYENDLRCRDLASGAQQRIQNPNDTVREGNGLSVRWYGYCPKSDLFTSLQSALVQVELSEFHGSLLRMERVAGSLYDRSKRGYSRKVLDTECHGMSCSDGPG